METQANTIWTKAYTPAGFQVGITIGFEAGHLPQAVDIDRMIADAGYLITLPGVEPGEDVEPILYVCRKNHTDTKTGAIVPHIAFYSENDNLTKRWTHTYLDTPEQVAEFENGTGLKVADMPVYDGDLHPDRTKSKAVIKLVKTIKVVRDFYETKDGEPRRPFKRFVDSIGTPQASEATATSGDGTPSNVTTLPAQPNASGNSNTDSSAWRKQVMDLTAFLYNDENMKYNQFEHTASIQKRMNDTGNMGINPDKHTPDGAASVVLAYRATKDLNMTVTEFPQALNGHSLKLFMADYDDTAKGLQAAWAKMVDHAMKKSQPQAANS